MQYKIPSLIKKWECIIPAHILKLTSSGILTVASTYLYVAAMKKLR